MFRELVMKGRECTKCKEFKPWSEFSKQKGGRNNHSARCKKCQVEYSLNNYYSDKHKFYIANTKAKNKQKGGVYLVTCKEGRYIGQSKQMKYRCQHHKFSKESRCFGKEFLRWEVLEYIEDPDLRLQREAYWINKLKPELN